MQIFKTNEMNLLVKSWCPIEELDKGALEQVLNLSNLPMAYHHIALMPDAHQGYGMPIGAVTALDGFISPNMVGVDIGCGVIATRTNITRISKNDLLSIKKEIYNSVPVGSKHRMNPSMDLMPSFETKKYPFIQTQDIEETSKQIGTLGSGNHFIEFQKDSDGYLWIMIHSGSRNLGKRVADHYNKEAIKFDERYFPNIPRKWDLALFPLDSEAGQNYLTEMNYCLRFADQNRKAMNKTCLSIIESFYPNLRAIETVSIHHNYAASENHYDKEVMVHRKGATLAKENIGIIPGSQGTNSYIIRGKNSIDSFTSCSHGAGRRMGRKEAIRSLDLKKEIMKLDKKGVIHSVSKAADLEEAAGAYKPIEEVIANQSDLIEIVTELAPIMVLKG